MTLEDKCVRRSFLLIFVGTSYAVLLCACSSDASGPKAGQGAQKQPPGPTRSGPMRQNPTATMAQATDPMDPPHGPMVPDERPSAKKAQGPLELKLPKHTTFLYKGKWTTAEFTYQVTLKYENPKVTEYAKTHQRRILASIDAQLRLQTYYHVYNKRGREQVAKRIAKRLTQKLEKATGEPPRIVEVVLNRVHLRKIFKGPSRRSLRRR